MPKLDSLIQRRFEELIRKAQLVRETYDTPVHDRRSVLQFYHMDSAVFEEWATNVLGLLGRVFKQDSIYYQNFHTHYSTASGGHNYSVYFEDCLGVLKAAKEDYEGGYLFDIITLAKADTMTDLLAEAEILKNANQVDFACIAAGIALELAAREICKRENCNIGNFNVMNEALWKKSVYNQAMWEQLKSWYTRRSDPAHGKLGQSTPRDADEMIKGVRRFIADYL